MEKVTCSLFCVCTLITKVNECVLGLILELIV